MEEINKDINTEEQTITKKKIRARKKTTKINTDSNPENEMLAEKDPDMLKNEVQKEIERIKNKRKIKTEKVEPEVKQEEAVDEKPDVPTPENEENKPKESNPYKIATIALAILSLILIICLFSNKKGSTKATSYDVTSIVPAYALRENVKLELPADYRLSDEGIIYLVNDETIKALCTMSCVQASEDDYNGAIEYYKQNLDLKELEDINGFKVGKLVNEQNNVSFTYYFLYKDGLFNEFIFADCDEETMSTIIKGFNY